MIEKQFTLYLENKPGVLAHLTQQLARAKVNIEGISVAESTDVAIVQIVADKTAAASRALKAAKIPFTVQNVAVLRLKNQPGALAEVVSQLARARVNINYVYATGCSCSQNCECYAVISAPDLNKVKAAWKAAGH
jgi:hypothetical protein